jgi:hypothetical protein
LLPQNVSISSPTYESCRPLVINPRHAYLKESLQP